MAMDGLPERRGRRRATAQEVAQLAGVSQSAVSRCFTPGASVSEEMRARVLAAARHLSYRPNAIARSLTTARTDLIGVVMADLDGPFQPYLFEHLTRGLATLGKQPLLVRGTPSDGLGGASMAALDYQVDAIVITAGSVSAAAVDAVKGLGVPLFLYGRVEAGVDCVCCDNAPGARLVADALVDAGHRRIAYIAGRPTAFAEQERAAGFRAGLAARGVALAAVGQGDYGYESGYRAALALLSADPRPEAIFCGNDAMAFGALDAARTGLGLRVPHDVSVVGFDDVPMAAWPSFALSTVRNPVDSIVDSLLAMLRRRLADPDAVPEVVRAAPTLVRRASARL